MTIDSDRLGGLARTKLEVLVRRAFPEITANAESFNAGAAICQNEAAFVYLTDSSLSPLAAALAWGDSRGCTDLHVIVDAADAELALQIRGLEPVPSAWQAVGTDLLALDLSARLVIPEVPEQVTAKSSLLTDAGCDPVIEHGVLIGEVLGLEVARVVVEQDGEAVVRVGVGLYDQDAHALIHARSSIEDRLRQVVAEVRRHRRSDGAPHPLNRAARERWLRRVVVDAPSMIGLDTLESLEPVVARGAIYENEAVAALGTRDVAKVLVVASVGIDLGLVPTAAAHLVRESVDEVVLLLPERDHHAVIRRMAAHLAVAASLCSIPDPWP